MKSVVFAGAAGDELRSLPVGARHALGRQLLDVQRGTTPAGSKPMNNIGPGVRELRVRTDDTWWRLLYVVTDVVVVLIVFRKQSNRTPQDAIETARRRYRESCRTTPPQI